MGSIIVKDLLERTSDRLGLQLLSGKSGLLKPVRNPGVQIFNSDPVFWSEISPGTILIVGRDGLSDFSTGTFPDGNIIFTAIRNMDIACIIFSEVNFLPRHLIRFSELNGITFFTSRFDQFLLRSRVLGYLREKIEGVAVIQGVFISVFDVGIVIKGDSGIGKRNAPLN